MRYHRETDIFFIEVFFCFRLVSTSRTNLFGAPVPWIETAFKICEEADSYWNSRNLISMSPESRGQNFKGAQISSNPYRMACASRIV